MSDLFWWLLPWRNPAISGHKRPVCVHSLSGWIIFAPLNTCGLYSQLAGVKTIKVSKMLNTVIALEAKRRLWSWWFTELRGCFASVPNAGARRPSAKRHPVCGSSVEPSHPPSSFLLSLHSRPTVRGGGGSNRRVWEATQEVVSIWKP